MLGRVCDCGAIAKWREGAALRLGPELADPLGTLEVGEHQYAEEFGAGSRP
jgi:hypothetical protein